MLLAKLSINRENMSRVNDEGTSQHPDNFASMADAFVTRMGIVPRLNCNLLNTTKASPLGVAHGLIDSAASRSSSWWLYGPTISLMF